MRRLAVLGLLAAAVAGCEITTGTGTPLGSGAGPGGGATGGQGGNAGSGGPGSTTNPLPQDLIDAFVSEHNQARSGPLNPPPSPPLPPVGWDGLLADVAYNHALRCQGSSGLLDHNASRSADYQALGGSGYVGENIFGSTGTATPARAMTLWMDEAADYDYASGDIGNAGHYTQIVWRDSVRIGCAIVDCPALTYHNTVICDYAPGGNISGERPY
jgi:hypothetical protein